MKKKFLKIQNTTLIGQWEEVQQIKASSITKNEGDTEVLDGLIIKGYEMKFGQANENEEIYEKDCFDKFINTYFVDNKLNIPVDIQHRSDLLNLAGRVIYAEVNGVGLYFVAYIPKTYIYYDVVKNCLKEKILQGFSKCGYATDYEYLWNEDGSFKAINIKEMALLSVSLVATPANSIKFENVQEIQNATRFKNKTKTKTENKLKRMFNY